MAISIKENVRRVKSKIPGNVKIVAASKYATAEQIKEAHEAGLKIFGENRVQDLLQKQEVLSDLPLEWHFIGHLQTNKVKKIIGRVALLHSVDSLKLADEISKCSIEIHKKQPILMQVNISLEATKGGFKPSESLQIARQIANLEGIELVGLMSIAPFTSEKDVLEKHFAQAKRLFNTIKSDLVPGFKWLSMGMSNDFETAIRYGANLLRLGSIIFRGSYEGHMA